MTASLQNRKATLIARSTNVSSRKELMVSAISSPPSLIEERMKGEELMFQGRVARKESRLLDSIGTAHMEQEIEKRVIALTKQNQDRMAEETGIQSSLSEEEIKQYVEQVIREVKKPKMSDDDITA